MLFVGIYWAEDHHDLVVMSADGEVMSGGRIADDLAGVGRLHVLVADQLAEPDEAVVVGIETDRGLFVSSLIASGYVVYAVNPNGRFEVSRPAQHCRHQVRRGRREDARRSGPNRPSHVPSDRRKTVMRLRRSRCSPGHASVGQVVGGPRAIRAQREDRRRLWAMGFQLAVDLARNSGLLRRHPVPAARPRVRWGSLRARAGDR